MPTKKKISKSKPKGKNIRIHAEDYETISTYCKDNHLIMGSWVAKTCVDKITSPKK